MSNTYEKKITSTLEENYMPYAMSVIVSRAIPEIDGLKPSHRKILYTMYKMGLLSGDKTKSANVVGSTMKLHPHGDMAIYETMVRMSRGYGALLHPYVESKGNFGKVYSRDMSFAAPRYTEVALDPICAELFGGIDKDTVDYVDNYDNTMKEPVMLPVTFPNILVNPNQGIAVGMASNICSFNLVEICDTTIALIKDENHPIATTLLAPDFSTGADLIYDRAAIESIYDTGRGNVKLRSKYSYDKKQNLIEVTEIPYTTTSEAIIDKVVELSKQGKIKEISDIRDETDLSGLKITIDLKRGTDPDALMARLYKLTPLEDQFACNFNILIAGSPRVMGIREILSEWIAFRTECVRRGLFHDIGKMKDKLHLLKGLKLILLDIDKAVKIVRETKDDSEVVPNLMIGFGVDEAQAGYIAEIKLRNLNKDHVLKRIAEVDELEVEIAKLSEILESKSKLRKMITDQLLDIKKRLGAPRRTEILYEDTLPDSPPDEPVADYAVTFFLSREGYFKKITPLSLRMSGEYRLKDGDAVSRKIESTNRAELLFFTDRHQVYKFRASDFEDTKASLMGDYVPTKLGMDQGENVVFMAVTADYSEDVMFFFENGKCARVPLSAYATKTNRKKLANAYSGKSPLIAAFQVDEPADFVLTASNGRTLIVNTAAVPKKATRDTIGVAAISLKGKNILQTVLPLADGMFEKPDRYRTKNLPAAGSFLTDADRERAELQISLVSE